MLTYKPQESLTVKESPRSLTVSCRRALDSSFINAELRRRQGGYGRGERQSIETDSAEILTGVLHGTSIGSPILLWVKNKDYKLEIMPELTRPRPGHGDLTGSVKFGCGIRPILERSSARETAGRVAAGALARLLLHEIGVEVVGYVSQVGNVDMSPTAEILAQSPQALREIRNTSSIYSLRKDADPAAERAINEAKAVGDTLGGIVETRVFNAPFGLGTHTQWSSKLDGRIAQASLQFRR